MLKSSQLSLSVWIIRKRSDRSFVVALNFWFGRVLCRVCLLKWTLMQWVAYFIIIWISFELYRSRALLSLTVVVLEVLMVYSSIAVFAHYCLVICAFYWCVCVCCGITWGIRIAKIGSKLRIKSNSKAKTWFIYSFCWGRLAVFFLIYR